MFSYSFSAGWSEVRNETGEVQRLPDEEEEVADEGLAQGACVWVYVHVCVWVCVWVSMRLSVYLSYFNVFIIIVIISEILYAGQRDIHLCQVVEWREYTCTETM